MEKQCEFLGAVRLPDNTFKGNAGTEVVADIILLRKAEIGENIEQKHNFLDVRSIPFTDSNGKNGIISYNGYFHENPKHLLGTVEFGGLYNKEGFNLKGDNHSNPEQNIYRVFDSIFPEPVYVPRLAQIPSPEIFDGGSIKNYISLGLYDSIGNIVSLDNDRFGTITGENHIEPRIIEMAKAANIDIRSLREGKPDDRTNDWMAMNGLFFTDFNNKVVEPLKVSKADAAKLSLLIKLRWLAKEVIYREIDGWTGQNLEDRRAFLRETYQGFTRKFGNLTSKENEKILSVDTDGILMQSLERKDSITKRITPSDILYRPTIKTAQELAFTDNIRDAIMLSLKRKGHLDMNVVCELMDKPYQEVMAGQVGDKAEIFIDATGKHVAREDFLSGNILQKISVEEKRLDGLQTSGADKTEIELCANNIAQLKAVLPRPIEATDIYAPLHARWMPEEDIRGFIKHAINSDAFELGYSNSLDGYKLRIRMDNAHSDAFKTQRRKADWIIEHALNGEEPLVNYSTPEGRQVLDAEDTHLAKEKYKAIKNLWDD